MNIQVTELIREQSYECLIMFCSGIAFMIAYEFCSFLSHKINLNKVWRIGLELLFWAASAIMVSEFLYYCAYGKLSVHSIGAFAAGLLLWKFGFYGIIYPNIHTKTKIKGLKKIHGEKKKKPRV